MRRRRSQEAINGLLEQGSLHLELLAFRRNKFDAAHTNVGIKYSCWIGFQSLAFARPVHHLKRYALSDSYIQYRSRLRLTQAVIAELKLCRVAT